MIHIETYKYHDHITQLTLPNQDIPMVCFTLVIRAGAGNDPRHQSGRQRLMADLLLRGTSHKTRHVFHAALDAMGAVVHVTVDDDTTIIRGVALTRYIEATCALVGEALQTPAFDAHELTMLRDESIATARAMRDDDDSVAAYFFRRYMYAGSPYARSPYGEIADMQQITLADIRAAHDGLQHQEMVIAFAGATDSQQAALCSRLLLGKWLQHNKHAATANVLPAISKPAGLHIVIVDKPERTQVQQRLGFLSISGKHPDADAFLLGITAFGGTFTSPLTRAVRDERGWSYIAQATWHRRSLHNAPVVLYTAPAVDDASACLQLQWRLLHDVSQAILAPEAVLLARDYLLNRYPFDIATAFDVLDIAVRDTLLGFAADAIYDFPNKLAAFDINSIPSVLQKHVPATSLLAILVGPAEVLMPALQQHFHEQSTISTIDFCDGL